MQGTPNNFLDGKKVSIEETIIFFDEFERKAGLKISLEKSTLYLAGVSDRDEITASFPFSLAQLPVRYLGLSLMTKRITNVDYKVLTKKIRSRFNFWTVRHLSYAGRLQPLGSVIASMVNFWFSAYRLPQGCLVEIEKLCTAFLSSGPYLNPKKANRHGEHLNPSTIIIKIIGKDMRNRLSYIRVTWDHDYDESLSAWFGTR